MRHAFSFVIIAFSVSALLGGYLSGRAAVPHFPRSIPSAQPAVLRAVPQVDQIDEVPYDEFADDAAVALPDLGGDLNAEARLAVVLLDAGRSHALTAPFFGLRIPMTVVIDPHGAASSQTARDATEAGDGVYVQAHVPLDAAFVRRIRAAFPSALGVALRVTGFDAIQTDALVQLRRERLAVLDEYGEAGDADARFAKAHIPYAMRSITIDDHGQRSYVEYMLREAVRVGRGRTAVVMARPFPGTLQALDDLLARASRDGVRFVGLR